MATTAPKTLTIGAWIGIADGPGLCTFTPQDASVAWCIGTTTPPTISVSHAAPRRVDQSMQLASGERLYVRGTGLLAVTADVPV